MDVNHYAKILWEYHLMQHKIEEADCIIVLGSMDTRVAVKGAELYLKGLAPVIVFSGGLGRLTKGVWDKPEGEVFADIAKDIGVPGDKIIIESESTNTGENIIYTKEKLFERKLIPEKIIAVHKPYMERRTYASISKLWPEVKVMVTSPDLTYKEYCKDPPEGLTGDEIINIIVGDLDRIRKYPEKGYQIYQEIPPEVLSAFEKLVELGYTKYLVR
ncbi:MAG: YdcF family protein [Bacillota bacterium]|nr:YdcF family protein [Bacillota bacterium]